MLPWKNHNRHVFAVALATVAFGCGQIAVLDSASDSGSTDEGAPDGARGGPGADAAIFDATTSAETGPGVYVDGGTTSDGSAPVDAAAPWPVGVDAGPPIPIDPSPACPAPGAPPNLAGARLQSGTRIVPRTIAEPVPGGVELPYDVFDSQLGLPCLPGKYADGTSRCIPQLHLMVAKRYADAAHTMPITLELLASSPAPGTLTAIEYGGCGVTLDWQGRIGGLRASTQYYDQGSAMPSTAPAGYGVFDVIPGPIDLAELTPVLTRLSPGVATRQLQGADGSRVFTSDLHDIAHDTDVKLATTDAGPRLLPPTAAPAGGHFLTPPDGGIDSPWCASSDLTFMPGTTCAASPGPSSPFATASLPTGIATYQLVPQTGTLYACAGGPQLDGPPTPVVLTSWVRTVWTPCAQIPLTDWALAPTITIGRGRLTADVPAPEGVPYAAPSTSPRLFDHALGKTCYPVTMDDGQLHCLPMDNVFVAYADAACTMRVAAGNSGMNPSYVEAGSRPSYAFPQASGVVSTFAVGASRPSAQLWWKTPETCSSLGTRPSWEVGAPVPASTFASLELRNAP